VVEPGVADGKADYPVSDITWYEAAYAAFRGKQLPTIFYEMGLAEAKMVR
jgi:formylglycine-generating enzyme required for sulfatase activity